MIACNLIKIPEYIGNPTSRAKVGRYHGSSFWDIKGFGSKKWVIAAYIEVHDQAIFDSMSEREIIEGCLETLNTPPPRKKYAKKDPKPKYGKLELYKSSLVRKSGKTVISTLLITSEKKNKLFWGKGRS